MFGILMFVDEAYTWNGRNGKSNKFIHKRIDAANAIYIMRASLAAASEKYWLAGDGKHKDGKKQ